nr:uncharacterized protein LOC111513382 [Leptinotarsa decemlineata]
MQKYSLYSKNNNSELKTESISCDCFGSPRPKGISVKRSKFQSNNFIILVELDLEEIESLEMPLYNMKMVDTGDFVNLQRIFLSPDFLNSNPNYSIDISGTSLVIKENDYEKFITFQCCICFVKLQGSEINVIQSSNKSFCSFCVEYYKAKKPNTKIDTFTIPPELLAHLKFFCKWNCNELIPYFRSSIFHEENFCSQQPSKNCPVESCVFEGKLYELQNHFLVSHQDSKLNLNSNQTYIKPPSKPNAFPTKTHRTGFLCPVEKFSYFFVQNTFVLLKKLDEQEKHIFFIDYCKKEDANNDFQPAVSIFAPNYVDTFRSNFVQEKVSWNTLSMNVILEKVSP